MNKIAQKDLAELKKGTESVGHEIKKVVERIGHEIKENTELAEHEAGVDNAKKDAKSVYDKMKEAL